MALTLTCGCAPASASPTGDVTPTVAPLGVDFRHDTVMARSSGREGPVRGLATTAAPSADERLGASAQTASRCPPGTRKPAAIAWWVVVPFFISLAVSAPMFAALTKSEQGRIKRLIATVAVFVTGFAISVALFVWQVTRCVPV